MGLVVWDNQIVYFDVLRYYSISVAEGSNILVLMS